MTDPDSPYMDAFTDRAMKWLVLFIGIAAWLLLVWIMF